LYKTLVEGVSLIVTLPTGLCPSLEVRVIACHTNSYRLTLWVSARVEIVALINGSFGLIRPFSSPLVRGAAGWRLAPSRATREEDDEKVRLRYK
jgi:hypothetical protein